MISRKVQHIVVMGVAGCGKTTVGAALAAELGYRFVDADDHHPQCNIDKMRRGVPLSDDDRWPWLDGLNDLLQQSPEPVVLACSALRQVYRARLARNASPIFVFLELSAAEATRRLESRDHFFPASLMGDQFATLEPPASDQGWRVFTADADQSLELVVAEVIAALKV